MHAVPMLVCQGTSFYLKYLVEKGHNSKTISIRVMPLVLLMHLVMMSKYSKFGVDTFNTFWVMGTLKFLHNNGDNNDNDLANTIAQHFFETDELKNVH